MPRARQTYSYVDEWKSRWEPELGAIAYNGATCDPTRVDPKVLEWVKRNCHDDTPHFVKIINPNAAKGKPGLMLKNSSSLTVPSPFVREHFRKLERVVSLENDQDGSRKWRVSFGAPKRGPQWLQGWDRVARDNNFMPGDVVVFVLVGNSRFRFTHFDPDGNLTPNLNQNLSPNLTDSRTARAKSTRSSSQDQSLDEAQSVRNLEEQYPAKKKTKRALDGPSDIDPHNGTPSASPDEIVAVVPQMEVLPAASPVAEASCKESRLCHFEEGNSGGRSNHDYGLAIVKSRVVQSSMSVEEFPKRRAVDSDKHVVDVRKEFHVQIDRSFDPFGFAIKSKRKVTSVVEKERAKDAAMAHARTLSEHHFVVVMAETQVYHDFHLVLPESFVKKSCLPTTSATRLLLEDVSGNPWEMFIKKNKFNEVAFHRKFWALFALHHLLEEGDVCVFHLKQNVSASAARTLVVHMFRVVPISAPISLRHHFALQKIRSATAQLMNPTS